jgi:serine/threonine protein kinase
MSDSHEPAGFSAPDPTDLAPLFPGYEIQGLIATGGMGAVYRAVQRSLDRTVALKILPMEFSQDAAFCAGFEAEAKAMARLNHPNLIGVYDFGEVNGMLYIIMEYVAGQSIYHATYGQAVEPAEVVRLVTGICNGLAHAHENGILHRDIKPSNILLDLNANPKIGDFGLARPVDRKIEEGEEIFGTPHYTAPEVVDAPQSVDYRADIFSVGVLLHELLTGKLPASDPRPASTIVRCDPRFDTIVRRAISAALE